MLRRAVLASAGGLLTAGLAGWLSTSSGDAEAVHWTDEPDVGGVLTPTVAGATGSLNPGTEPAAVARADGTRRWQVAVGARFGAPVVVDDTASLRTNPGHNDASELVAVRAA